MARDRITKTDVRHTRTIKDLFHTIELEVIVNDYEKMIEDAAENVRLIFDGQQNIDREKPD